MLTAPPATSAPTRPSRSCRNRGGSWEADAWTKDKASGRFLDSSKLQPINRRGKHVASRGPLAVPPPEQGQPVIFTSGGPSPDLLQIAGGHASGFIAEVWTIEETRALREMVRDAARQAGRDPDEIKYFAGLMTTVAPTVREGLDPRLGLSGEVINARLPHLGALLGLHIDPDRYDAPPTPDQLAAAQASPRDSRSGNALEVALAGWSPRDVLTHGVIDYHPTRVGPGGVHADHLQKWFEAGAVDGFWISPDVPNEYPGTTLRENLGVARRYGFAPRLSSTHRRAARYSGPWLPALKLT